MSHQIGVAHLTLLRLPPDEFVGAAAKAGYDFVGIRVAAVTRDEGISDMRPGSAMSKATIDRLNSTGLIVRDVEFLALDHGATAELWLPALEAGAALGATTLSVTGADSDLERLGDTLSALAADAKPFGILPTIEPISYQPLSSLSQAAALAQAAGAGVLIDSLHLQRGGGGVEDVRAVAPHLVPIAQICDAPLATPLSVPLVPHSARPTTDTAVRQAEARTFRLAPGSGELPLAELISALPPETPLSVEVPNWLLSSSMEPWRFLEFTLRALRGVLDTVDGESAR